MPRLKVGDADHPAEQRQAGGGGTPAGTIEEAPRTGGQVPDAGRAAQQGEAHDLAAEQLVGGADPMATA